MTALGGGAVATPSATADASAARPAPRAMAEGKFWTVSGIIEAGGVRFDSLFDDATRGLDDSGAGTHRIEMRDAGCAVLFTRGFTPAEAHTEEAGSDGDITGPPAFCELVPFNAAAAAIAVVDPDGATLGELALGGSAPVVTLLQPLGGTLAGQQGIAWQVADPDSAGFASKAYYSADSGASWSQIGMLEGELALQADFDLLPGGDGTVLLKVAVSDGVTTGSVTSPPLSVPKKVPQDVRILMPAEGAAFAPEALVRFEGGAYDVDDGMLHYAAVVTRLGNPVPEPGAPALMAALLAARRYRGTRK